jgi:isoleucyl-tRNA synthetase
MRAGLPKREPEMQQTLGRAENVYNGAAEEERGQAPLLPPRRPSVFQRLASTWAHAMNKALKDIIVRSYAMRGWYTPYIPGWDNHGMPIESAIIKQNKLDRKKPCPCPEFRSACHEFAHALRGRPAGRLQAAWACMGDWDHPYLTMDPGFEAEEVKVFGEMYKKGYIYKGLKPVYWCPQGRDSPGRGGD